MLYSNGLGPGQKQDVSTVVEKTAEVILEGQIGDDLYGWMEDETFFDEEDAPEKGQEGESLSLIATSVEKDLRIQIVDERGKTVEGQFFRILLNGTDEYKDLDRDGVIYIGQLDAGEYQVSLMEKEGFAVPALALPVKVKSRVEYVAIGDISLLIKTEKEVDAMAEDGESEQALAEAAGTTEILTRECRFWH